MLNTQEHIDMIAHFEKGKKGFRLDREPKESWPKGIIYQHGELNQLFLEYRKGYALAKCIYQEPGDSQPAKAEERVSAPSPAVNLDMIKDRLDYIITRCRQFGYDGIIEGLAIEAIQHITSRSAQAGTREAPAPGIEKAAREYVEAHRKAGAVRFGAGSAEDAFDADAAEDAAWTNLCVAVDGWKPGAQGSAGEAPALEEVTRALHKALQDDHACFWEVTNRIERRLASAGWIADGRGCYEHDDDRYRQETGNLIADLRAIVKELQPRQSKQYLEVMRQADAQGSPARSAPSSPRGSNPNPQVHELPNLSLLRPSPPVKGAPSPDPEASAGPQGARPVKEGGARAD